MKRALFPLVLVFTFMVGMTPAGAADYDLAAGMIPPDYYGLWAAPDCAQPDNVILIQDRLILDAQSHANFVYRITETRTSDNGLLAHFGNMNIYLDKKNDAAMDITKTFLDEGHEPDHPYQDTASHKTAYTACEQIDTNWPSTDKEALDAFPAIAALEQQCEGAYIEDSPACQQQIFMFADQDMNGKLDHQELERLYKLAVYYGGSIACEFPHVFPGTTKSDADIFATQLISVMDRNSDQMITLEDVRNGWDIALLEQPMAGKFMDFTDDLATLIYSIPHYPYIER